MSAGLACHSEYMLTTYDMELAMLVPMVSKISIPVWPSLWRGAAAEALTFSRGATGWEHISGWDALCS